MKILSISDKFNNYAWEVGKRLEEAGIRVEVDDREEKVGYKVRAAQMEKVPYSLIVGEKEVEGQTVSVRKRDGVDEGVMPLDEFLAMIQEEIKTKEIA